MVSSPARDVLRAATMVRAHKSIEMPRHRLLDVAFDKDHGRLWPCATGWRGEGLFNPLRTA